MSFVLRNLSFFTWTELNRWFYDSTDTDSVQFLRGRSETTQVNKILAFYDHLPPCVDIDKKWTFWGTAL